MHWKNPLGIISILAFSFFWGYRGRDICVEWGSSVRDWWDRPASSAADVPPDPASLPGADAPLVIGGGQPAAAAPGSPDAGSAPFGNLPPEPAHAGPGPGVAPGSLANTLDAIRPGQVPPDKLASRNEYFQRLSQQLRSANANGTAPPDPPGAGFGAGTGAPPLMPPGPTGVNDVPPPISNGPFGVPDIEPPPDIEIPPPPAVFPGNIAQETSDIDADVDDDEQDEPDDVDDDSLDDDGADDDYEEE